MTGLRKCPDFLYDSVDMSLPAARLSLIIKLPSEGTNKSDDILCSHKQTSHKTLITLILNRLQVDCIIFTWGERYFSFITRNNYSVAYRITSEVSYTYVPQPVQSESYWLYCSIPVATTF